MLKDFFTPAYNLDSATKTKLRKAATWIGVALVVLVIFLGGWQAGTKVDADAPLWEAVIFARLFLLRLVAAAALLVMVPVFAVMVLNALDNTKVGERLFLWKDESPDWLKAQKISNLGTVFVGLLLAGALVMAQVLR